LVPGKLLSKQHFVEFVQEGTAVEWLIDKISTIRSQVIPDIGIGGIPRYEYDTVFQFGADSGDSLI
jgi:hypothetical protein